MPTELPSRNELQTELLEIYGLLLAKAARGELTVCERTVRERIAKLLDAAPSENAAQVDRLRQVAGIAVRCRPAVVHYMRTTERSAMSESLSLTGKQAAEAEAAKLGKLLDEIDALLGPHVPPVPPNHFPVA